MGQMSAEASRQTKEELLKVFRTTEIIKAARRVIMEVGYTDASMDRIAHEAGVAKGTLYLYFKNKDELLARTFSEEHAQLMGRIRKSAEAATSFTEKISAIVRETMAHAMDHQAFRQALYGAPDISPFGTSSSSAEIRREVEEYGGFLARVLEGGMGSSEFRHGDASQFALYLTQLVYGAVTTLLRKPDDPTCAPSAEEIVDFFLRGARAE